MDNTTDSIYENLCRVRNELETQQLEYHLPREENSRPNEVRFADGALDGIALYHMGIPDQDIALLEQAVSTAATDMNQAHELVRQWVSEDGHIISAWDKLLRYVDEHRPDLPPSDIYRLAAECALKGMHREEVKFGLTLLLNFDTDQNEPLKNALRILALSDEFTLYVLQIAANWTKSPQEILRIAKNVHGWGRIHAVLALEPETQEIEDWLFREGWNNKILPAYSALECCRKAKLQKRLEDGMGENDFSCACKLLIALLEEGPVEGISQIENSAELLDAFVSCAVSKGVSPERQNALKLTEEYALSHDLPELAQRIRFLL